MPEKRESTLKIITCPRCNGSGNIKSISTGFIDGTIMTCPSCDGKGIIRTYLKN